MIASLVLRLEAAVTSTSMILARVTGIATRPHCSPILERGGGGTRQNDRSRRAGGWGNQGKRQKPLPFVGRMLVYVRL